MKQLTALINNFNMNCHKQYTKVSNYLGSKLDDSLKEIERFYYSDFWTSRFKRRLKEEDFPLASWFRIIVEYFLVELLNIPTSAEFAC